MPPYNISNTLQKTPSFHAKLSFFFNPHAHRHPNNPPRIGYINQLITKNLKEATAPLSKLSKVNDEPDPIKKNSKIFVTADSKNKASTININERIIITIQIYFVSFFSLDIV